MKGNDELLKEMSVLKGYDWWGLVQGTRRTRSEVKCSEVFRAPRVGVRLSPD